MTTLEAETDIKNTVQTTEAVEVFDCGRVSECTRGVSFGIVLEIGIPPYDKLPLT